MWGNVEHSAFVVKAMKGFFAWFSWQRRSVSEVDVIVCYPDHIREKSGVKKLENDCKIFVCMLKFSINFWTYIPPESSVTLTMRLALPYWHANIGMISVVCTHPDKDFLKFGFWCTDKFLFRTKGLDCPSWTFGRRSISVSTFHRTWWTFYYIYRVNDDSEFLSPWAYKFVRSLQGMGSPYGVVGPWCNQSNTKILNHDFTHRTHMRIFKDYYPSLLTDWYLDDWISMVYGSTRTRQFENVEILHHTRSQNVRYTVDYYRREYLHFPQNMMDSLALFLGSWIGEEMNSSISTVVL